MSSKVLQRIVKSNKKVRAKGAGHSWSKIYKGPGIELDMRPYSRILWLQDAIPSIMVEAGMDLGQLMAYLASKGLTLPQMSATVGQTIGGALATATHGASKMGTLSNTLTQAILMNPDGSMVGSNALGLIGTSLGNFLLYAVSLKVVPDFPISIEIHNETINGLDMLQRIYKVYALDPKAVCLVAYYWPSMGRQAQGGVQAILLRRSNDATTMFSKAYSIPYGDLLPQEIRDIKNRVEMEQAIDAKDMIPAIQALDPITPIESILFLRFVGPDQDALMSMTYKRNSLFISLSLDPNVRYHLQSGLELSANEVFKAMERALIPFDARPHWGKINFLTRDRIQKLYPGFHTYVNSRRLYDPNGKFLGLESSFQ